MKRKLTKEQIEIIKRKREIEIRRALKKQSKPLFNENNKTKKKDI